MGRGDSFLSSRLADYTTTIFSEMSALAEATGSINLGQGFPDTDGPSEIAEAAVAAIRAGHNQYPPGPGIPALRAAISSHQNECYGLQFDPGAEVLVTTGATEAIAASLLGLLEPGDEVVMFEPYYDSYAACVSMAGGKRRVVQLRPPAWSFDPAELESAIGPRTKVLLCNSPHNPTGKVFSVAELALIARVCVEHDLIAITDEVYEHMVFEGLHRPLATFAGMAERTVTISSAAKTFSFTGWKIGWVCASEPLVAAVRAAKQFLTYVSGGPFQYAIAVALTSPPAALDVAPRLAGQRELLARGLAGIGLEVFWPAGTFFVTTDISPLGEEDGTAFCRSLPERCGVVAIPSAVFYDDEKAGRSMVRWTFCKRPEVLEEAVRRLQGLNR